MTLSINLTPHQIIGLKPLYDESTAAFRDGKRGIIIFQAWHHGRLQGSFVPEAPARKIQAILKETLCPTQPEKKYF